MSSQFRRSRYTPTPAGGSEAFGVNKFTVLGQALSSVGPITNPNFANGLVAQTKSIGRITDVVNVQDWFIYVKVVVKSISTITTIRVGLAVRDSTVMSAPDLSKLPASVSALWPDIAHTALAVGTDAGSSSNVSTVFSAIAGAAIVTDTYGNALSPGDTLALDLVVLFDANPGTVDGTFDAIDWDTTMLAP